MSLNPAQFISSPSTTPFDQVARVLKQEANAISQTLHQLQPSQITQAIQLLKNCQGKVLLLGIGKSGLIARKIAATLTSTGTPALYLHPSDALHGDIGIATPHDIAIVLSNSGETDELLGMLPYLNHRHIPIIAIVGNLKSTLARNATAILNATVEREACPFNLAPTASTTVALAIGDAIAMTLMQVKGLTPNDFAFNHPAGRLGKRLTLRVLDLMHPHNQAPALSPKTPWLDIILAIGEGGLGAVCIVDNKSKLLGLITDGDIRRSIRQTPALELNNLIAQDIMTSHPIVVEPDVLAFDALKLMEERSSQVSVLPVVNAEYLSLGLIRLHDIVRSGL